MAATEAEGQTEAIIDEWEEVTVSRYSDRGHRDDSCDFLQEHFRTFDTDAEADVIRRRGPLVKCKLCGSSEAMDRDSTGGGHLDSLVQAAAEEHGDDLDVEPVLPDASDAQEGAR